MWVANQSPVILQPGTYVIGALLPVNPTNPEYLPVAAYATIKTIPQITFLAGPSSNSAVFQEPGVDSPGRGNSHFGPSFLAEPFVAPVPEPSSLPLLAVAAAALAALPRRHRFSFTKK